MSVRNLKRQQLKKKYDNFVAAWNREVAFQRHMLNTGEAEETTPVKVDPLSADYEGPYDPSRMKFIKIRGETVPLLGHKPTFNQWAKAFANRQLTPKQEVTPEKEGQVEVTETDWNEETA